MRLTVIAFGTRGDVIPLLALGIRLQAVGHRVCLATHREFESLVGKHGLTFRSVPGSYQDFVATSRGRRMLGAPRASPFGITGLYGPFLPVAEAAFRESWEATADADGIVASAVAWPAALLIAVRRGLPLALGQVVPAIRTKAMPHPVFPPWPLGQLYNRATYVAGDLLVRRGGGTVFDRWHREAERLSSGSQPKEIKAVGLIAVSPHVVPPPDDWPPEVHVTGYWLLPQTPSEAVPDQVRGFVESGAPPICFGFGSMMDDNPEELRGIVVEVLERLRLRAVVVGGSGGALFGFGDRPNVCEVSFADYDWLFPRVSAVVHQGGAGTASFCLMAGVPQVIVRYCLDHTFWGSRMRALGVAPPSLRRNRLSASALSGTVSQALHDPRFRTQAVALAPRIRAEDGVAKAVEILTAHFNR